MSEGEIFYPLSDDVEFKKREISLYFSTVSDCVFSVYVSRSSVSLLRQKR